VDQEVFNQLFAGKPVEEITIVWYREGSLRSWTIAGWRESTDLNVIAVTKAMNKKDEMNASVFEALRKFYSTNLLLIWFF
jgi:hypothetical protein